MPRVRCEVVANIPHGVTFAEWREHIRSEIIAACGGLRPEDPLFELDPNSVKVSPVTKVSKEHA